MKIPKERRQLCDDVTNSHKIEARKRREKDFERQMDTIFVYVLLAGMCIAFVIALIDIWSGL